MFEAVLIINFFNVLLAIKLQASTAIFDNICKFHGP